MASAARTGTLSFVAVKRTDHIELIGSLDACGGARQTERTREQNDAANDRRVKRTQMHGTQALCSRSL
jgi:hypothetical protein